MNEQKSNVTNLRSIDGQNQQTAPAELPAFSLQAEIEGFPFTVEFRGKAERLRAIVDALKSQGAIPPAQPATRTAAATTGAEDGPPKCPHHQAALKPSKKPGTWFCPKKNGDDYCDYKWSEKGER